MPEQALIENMFVLILARNVNAHWCSLSGWYFNLGNENKKYKAIFYPGATSTRGRPNCESVEILCLTQKRAR